MVIAKPPIIVSLAALALGCMDMMRGVAHTVLLGSLAAQKSGLDFAAEGGPEQGVVMIAFGISNFVTAAALILTALWARGLALSLLTIIPVAYFVGAVSLDYWIGGLEATTAKWEGQFMLRWYLLACVCVATYGWWSVLRDRKLTNNPPTAARSN